MEEEWLKVEKGSQCPQTLLALAQGTTQDTGSHWLLKLARQSRPAFGRGGGRKVAYLSLVFLRAFVDHLSQSCNSRALAGGKGPHRHF